MSIFLDISWGRTRTASPRVGDRSPQRAGAVQFLGEDFSAEIIKRRARYRGPTGLQHFGMMEI
jgi:hypothetical protein